MAGVKGRSGSGGARPGAGRKPSKEKKPDQKVIPVETEGRDMLELLQDIALGKIEVSPIQLRAAIAAVQYTHTKRGDGGKKDEQADKARKASSKFSAAQPPRLAAIGGKKV